ncbi:methylesterase PCR A, partial [Prunus dulcis]
NMAIQQPLLDSPKTSTSHCKPLYLILCLAAILSSTTLVGIQVMTKITSSSSYPPPTHICDHAHDQKSCLAMVTEVVGDKTKPVSDVDLLQALLQKSTPHIEKALEIAKDASSRINNPKDQAAIADCVELMDVSIDRVMHSIIALQNFTRQNSLEDAHAWLSSILTNHVTCLDGLQGPARTIMEPRLNDLISRSRASLAIMAAISNPSKPKAEIHEPLNGEFPSWVTSRDRRLLQDYNLAKEVKANIVVAKDGSGNYKTLKEAVAAAQTVAKPGTYKENVEVGKNKKNLMIVGDGMDDTVITGSLNVVDGSTTFKSATLDMWFQNTAGAVKHQAVALRVGADQSVINRCRIDAYQDTLYTHSNRQFYRDSYITGTVDFIFGNAAVVFQNCKLVARKPMTGQNNMVTAQGRIDPNQNTGTSIQKCDIIASSDLEPVKGTIRSYLGRPWKEYSRTVVMQSKIGDHIDPTGWSIWSGDFALKTLYYGEYANSGAGAGTSERVKWAGYHVITSPTEAQTFTVAQLIQGGSWLKSTGVAYTEGL